MRARRSDAQKADQIGSQVPAFSTLAIGAVMGGHEPGDKIAEDELPERSLASKTPQNPSPELSRGPSALIFDGGSRRGHPEAPGGPKRRKRRFEDFCLSPGLCPPISVPMD